MKPCFTEQVMAALRESGFVEMSAGFIEATYPSIYQERSVRNQLTGLEPPWVNPEGAERFIDKRNVVIGVLMPYSLLPVKTKAPSGEISRISIMAWEWDYHIVFKKRLNEALLEFATDNPEARLLLHVDNGPLPERSISMNLGLTKPGKSQMVISDRYGTAFYIGLILLDDKNFVPSSSTQVAYGLHEACLNCNKCQTHCPSGALRAMGGFDGMRCISATTQLKGLLLSSQMEAMHNQLYGCDHCQLACPLNSPLFKSLPENNGIPALKAVESNSIRPEELLYLSQKAYKRAYGHLGFSWRGVKTAKRNALINMANSKDVKYIHVIERFMQSLEVSEDTVLIKTATWALDKLKTLHRGENT